MDVRRRARRARFPGVLFAGVAVATLAGCFADPTEVVIVVDTNATLGRDFTEVQFTVESGSLSTASAFSTPATLGVTPQGLATEFDVTVRLNVGGDNFERPTATPPFSTRGASHVQFIKDQISVLFLPMLKSCACTDPTTGTPSTNCAHALDPDCMDLTSPPLGRFDEEGIPHLSAAQKASP